MGGPCFVSQELATERGGENRGQKEGGQRRPLLGAGWALPPYSHPELLLQRWQPVSSAQPLAARKVPGETLLPGRDSPPGELQPSLPSFEYPPPSPSLLLSRTAWVHAQQADLVRAALAWKRGLGGVPAQARVSPALSHRKGQPGASYCLGSRQPARHAALRNTSCSVGKPGGSVS